MVGSCLFLIQFNNLCLFVEVFNPFTFTVITYRVGFMSVILLFIFYISYLFCSSVTPLLSSVLSEFFLSEN